MEEKLKEIDKKIKNHREITDLKKEKEGIEESLKQGIFTVVEDDDFVEHLLEDYKYEGVLDFLKYNHEEFFEDGDFEAYFKFKDKIYLLSFSKQYEADDACIELIESWDNFDKIEEGKYKLNK